MQIQHYIDVKKYVVIYCKSNVKIECKFIVNVANVNVSQMQCTCDVKLM